VVVGGIEGCDDPEGDTKAEVLAEAVGCNVGISIVSIGSNVSRTNEGNAVNEGKGVIVGRLDSEGTGTAVISVVSTGSWLGSVGSGVKDFDGDGVVLMMEATPCDISGDSEGSNVSSTDELADTDVDGSAVSMTIIDGEGVV